MVCSSFQRHRPDLCSDGPADSAAASFLCFFNHTRLVLLDTGPSPLNFSPCDQTLVDYRKARVVPAVRTKSALYIRQSQPLRQSLLDLFPPSYGPCLPN